MSDIDEQIRNIIGQIPNYILGYLEIGDDIKEEWKGEQPAYLKVYSDRIAKLIAQQVEEATINGLIMAKYGTDEGSKEERFIDNLIRQEQK